MGLRLAIGMPWFDGRDGCGSQFDCERHRKGQLRVWRTGGGHEDGEMEKAYKPLHFLPRNLPGPFLWIVETKNSLGNCPSSPIFLFSHHV